MKKLFTVLSAALVMFALSSCQNEAMDEINANESFATMEFAASIDKLTRTTLDATDYTVAWEEGDLLYVATTDEEWGPAYESGEDTTVSYPQAFAYDSTKGTFTCTPTVELSDGEHTFNVVYTAGKKQSFHRGDKTTNLLATTQTMDCVNPTAHIKTHDLLIGQFTATTPFSSIPNFDMKHANALMCVNIKNNGEIPMTVTSFTMTAVSSGDPQYLASTATVDFANKNYSAINNGNTSITVAINNCPEIAAGESLPVYFVIQPLVDFVGDITFAAVVNGVEESQTINFAEGRKLTFAAGTHNTTPWSVTPEEESFDVIDNTTEDYVVGFESTEDFTSSTTYDNDTEEFDGAEGSQWATLSGTPTTTDAIVGSQSLQMRYYTSVGANPYTYTTFQVKRVKFIQFQAKNKGNNHVKLSYKTTGDWIDVKEFTLSTTATTYYHTFENALENAQFKFTAMCDGATTGTNARVTLDAVTFSASAPEITQLVMSDITATPSTNSITYTWAAVANATKYQVSLDGDEWFDWNTTSYTRESLEEETEYTTYFRAIGNGVTSSDSESVAVVATTEKTPEADPDATYVTITFDGGAGQTDGLTWNASPIKVVANKNDGQNAPNEHATYKELRFYSKNSMTISGATITQVVFDFATAQTLDVNVGTYNSSTYTWTGSASSVTFTNNQSSQAKIDAITIYYVGGGETPETLATPTNLEAIAVGKDVTIAWYEVANATSYYVTCGTQNATVTACEADFTMDAYSTKYDITVVAKADGYTDSAAAATTVTTEADPNAGSGEGEGGESGIAIYTANFEADSAHRTSGNNSYTSNTYTDEGVTWNLTYADAVTSGSPLDGSANITARVARNTTNSPSITTSNIISSQSNISKVTFYASTNSSVTMKVSYSTDGNNWTEASYAKDTNVDETYGYSANINASGVTGFYLKFDYTVTSTTSSHRDSQLDNVVVFN